ncbi:hypothetical protein ZOSMA_52G00070 [Zostera marina]|uniref:Uncharacterized protein n=1 Tax=Zostera marina TaxID=29655 RepID=A0A0K9NZD5_ZOSMR|nr:hypothetical protein ZOSMA_52G00070 [Zostera marina]
MVYTSNHLGAQASPEHQSLSNDAKHWRSSMDDVDHRRMSSTANTSDGDPNTMAARPPPTMWSCRSQCNIYFVIVYFSLSDFVFYLSHLAYRVIANSSISLLIATLQLLIRWLRPSFQTWYQSRRRSHSDQNKNEPTTQQRNQHAFTITAKTYCRLRPAGHEMLPSMVRRQIARIVFKENFLKEKCFKDTICPNHHPITSNQTIDEIDLPNQPQIDSQTCNRRSHLVRPHAPSRIPDQRNRRRRPPPCITPHDRRPSTDRRPRTPARLCNAPRDRLHQRNHLQHPKRPEHPTCNAQNTLQSDARATVDHRLTLDLHRLTLDLHRRSRCTHDRRPHRPITHSTDRPTITHHR